MSDPMGGLFAAIGRAASAEAAKDNKRLKAQKEDTMSGTTLTANQLVVDAAIEALGNLGVINKQSYTRLAVGSKTVAYVMPGRVDVPQGDGSYRTFVVHTKAEIRKAVTAIKSAAKRASK